MDMEVKQLHWEKIVSVIQRSYTIDKHLDFFNWLQVSVNEVVSHDMLLASWGDFSQHHQKNKLNYDVASHINGVSTQSILAASDEIDCLMVQLHQAWLNNNRRWFTLDKLDVAPLNKQSDKDSVSQALVNLSFIQCEQLKSMLIYGVSDVRGGNECLYVFFSKHEVFEVQYAVMGLIMPHIDNVLRKIQHLSPIAPATSSADDMAKLPAKIALLTSLSERELEIMHWIKSGKTNQEIGMILDISQNTVKSHLKRVFQKLNVTRRAQAVAILSS